MDANKKESEKDWSCHQEEHLALVNSDINLISLPNTEKKKVNVFRENKSGPMTNFCSFVY